MSEKQQFIRTLDVTDMSTEEQQEYVVNYKSLSNTEKEYFDIMNSGYGVLNIAGKPGTAKSAIARVVADKMRMNYKDVRLSMLDETDVGLFPHLSEVEDDDGVKYHVLDHAVPRWALKANEVPTIIHFEELNRASLQVRNAALQLLLEKEIGTEFKFNKSVLMMSSGNLGEEDGTDVEEFDSALNNRLIHVKHDLKPSDWIEQYGRSNIHPIIVEYINSRPEEFYKKSSSNNGVETKAYATPRSWEMLSKFIMSTSITKAIVEGKTLTLEDIMNGSYDTKELIGVVSVMGHKYIGNSARAFVNYLSETLKLSINDVLSDFKRVESQIQDSNRDKKSELLGNLREMDIRKLKTKEIDNLIEFLKIINEDEIVAYLTFIIDKSENADLKKDPCNKILKSFSTLLEKISDMSC